MYLSICAKYGETPYRLACLAGIGLAASGHIALCSGMFIGAGAAVLSDYVVPTYLRQQRIGLTKGSKIYQQLQTGFFVASLLLGIGLEYTRVIHF